MWRQLVRQDSELAAQVGHIGCRDKVQRAVTALVTAFGNPGLDLCNFPSFELPDIWFVDQELP